MVRIIITDRMFIEKDRLRLLEGHAMLAFVLAALLLVPLKADIAHKYIVRIVQVAVNEKVAVFNFKSSTLVPCLSYHLTMFFLQNVKNQGNPRHYICKFGRC